HVDRNTGIADADDLSRPELDGRAARDRFAIDQGAVAAAEVFDPVFPVFVRNPGMRARDPQIRTQIDIDGYTLPRPPKHDRVARLVIEILNVPVAIADAHGRPTR